MGNTLFTQPDNSDALCKRRLPEVQQTSQRQSGGFAIQMKENHNYCKDLLSLRAKSDLQSCSNGWWAVDVVLCVKLLLLSVDHLKKSHSSLKVNKEINAGPKDKTDVCMW